MFVNDPLLKIQKRNYLFSCTWQFSKWRFKKKMIWGRVSIRTFYGSRTGNMPTCTEAGMEGKNARFWKQRRSSGLFQARVILGWCQTRCPNMRGNHGVRSTQEGKKSGDGRGISPPSWYVPRVPLSASTSREGQLWHVDQKYIVRMYQIDVAIEI